MDDLLLAVGAKPITVDELSDPTSIDRRGVRVDREFPHGMWSPRRQSVLDGVTTSAVLGSSTSEGGPIPMKMSTADTTSS
jgi:hypothetical protein